VFRTPDRLTADQLRVAGGRGAVLVRETAGDRPAGLVGVATRGIPLATAVTISLGVPATLSIAGKDGSAEHLSVAPGACTVVVDNALVTGRTAEGVLGRLRTDLFVYLFDREELGPHGEDPAARLADRFGCAVRAIFTYRDVIAAEPAEPVRRALVDYGKAFGTPSLRAHLSERYPD
jgi:orotate phosphoribosyltransferase